MRRFSGSHPGFWRGCSCGCRRLRIRPFFRVIRQVLEAEEKKRIERKRKRERKRTKVKSIQRSGTRNVKSCQKRNKSSKKKRLFGTNREDIRFRIDGELRMDFFSLRDVPLSDCSKADERFSMD